MTKGKIKTFIEEYTKEELEYIDLIRSKIDFEHSIAIHYPTSGVMRSIYIVEFKTEDLNRKAFFAFNAVDAQFALHRNFYITAIYTPSVLEKIPVWECEVSTQDLIDRKHLSCHEISDIFDRIYSAQQCQKMVCPEGGAFTAYKKVIGTDGNPYVCELLIPKDASRLSGFERKCRASKAKVIAMWELEYIDGDGAMHFIKTRKRVGYSIYKHPFRERTNKKSMDFVYRVGKTVKPDNGFDRDRFNTCAPGIHFFMTMVEAFTYRF